MSHEFAKGGMVSPSWHRSEILVKMATAEEMIHVGRSTGAWPMKIAKMPLFWQDAETGDYRCVRKQIGEGALCMYTDGTEDVHGIVGRRWHPCMPEEWDALIKTACDAGAVPDGAYSLRDGTRVIATFTLPASAGFENHMVICDAMDGSLRLCCGKSVIRVECANTLSACFSASGDAMAKLRHTASLKLKIAALQKSIEQGIASAQSIIEGYHKAEEMKLSLKDYERLFDYLNPLAAEDASPRAKTIANNNRDAARAAAALKVNNVGQTLATLWNASTFLVDRTPDGKARDTRVDTDARDAILFGQRAKRIEEIQTIIQVVLRDGSVMNVPAPKALEMGVASDQVGPAVLAGMIDDADALDYLDTN